MRVLGFLFFMVFNCFAQAQVNNKPILTAPPVAAVFDVRLVQLRGCVGWWEKDVNPFGDYHLVQAALDVKQLPVGMVEPVQFALNARDVAALTKVRTQDMVTLVDVYQPCKRLEPPSWRWSVPAVTSGQRPAYLLNADGTLGKQSGYISTTMQVAGQSIPTPCVCVLRAKGSTSAYCLTALSKVAPTDPDRVSLCRENK